MQLTLGDVLEMMVYVLLPSWKSSYCNRCCYLKTKINKQNQKTHPKQIPHKQNGDKQKLIHQTKCVE